MSITLIVAYDKNRLIGIGDQLAWEIKEDLEHFKKETLNKTILFGDVTFKGIGRPLPNRRTIVLTLDTTYRYEHEDVEVYYDMNDIIERYHNNPNEEIIIAGGATIYKLFLNYVDKIILSEVKGDFEGDVYFPEWDTSKFDLVSEDERNEFTIKKFIRKDKKNENKNTIFFKNR